MKNKKVYDAYGSDDYLYIEPSVIPGYLLIGAQEGGGESGIYVGVEEARRIRKILKQWLKSLEEGE